MFRLGNNKELIIFLILAINIIESINIIEVIFVSKLSFNSLINLKLTQESGQTSQAPWFSIEEKDENNNQINSYFELIFLKDLDNLPILAKVSQNSNDLNHMKLDYQLVSDDECDVDFTDESTIFTQKEIEFALTKEITKIFNLNFDLEKFYKHLADTNDKLVESIEFCKGLRLFIAKDKFECIISSICSANNSIARWTNSTNQIKSNWGYNEDFIVNNQSKTFCGFPKISELEDKDLKSCGVGYREDYMKKSEDLLLNGIDIDEIANMNYDEAFETISKLPGVGPKVADCILLYGYGFMEAFPSDVWIKRIVSHLYFDGKEISANKTRDFGMEHFGDYAGYAQLYLFHYARKSGLMNKLKK